MRKTSCFGLMLLSIFCMPVSADQNIQQYINKHFGTKLYISKAQLDQLSWANAHVRPTPDHYASQKQQLDYIEIGRALTRVYCARLLRVGDRESYNAFVAAQLQHKQYPVLSFATFAKLSSHIQNLSVADFKLLETAAILSAVSLSKPAAALAQKALINLPNDKMDFLATTIRNEQTMYPLLAEMLQNNDTAKKMLYILFPPQTNFRHMLYTEGGIGMYKYLRTMIQHGFIDRSGLELWYSHWIINLAGFRGHVAQNGALYLNEPTAQAVIYAYGLVKRMLEMPNFDPLIPYLEYRAKQLGFDNLPQETRLFAAHMGCLLRVYDAKRGVELLEALNDTSNHTIIILKKHFLQSLIDPNQPIHLHLPALYCNALQESQGSIVKTLATVVPIHSKCILLAAQRNIKKNLSFDVLAKQNIHSLQNKDLQLDFSSDGTVIAG